MSIEKEFQYYQKNKVHFIKKYNGKYIVLMNKEVIGFFDSREKALIETQRKHKPGTFLIQLVSKEEEVQRYYSRVVFS